MFKIKEDIPTIKHKKYVIWIVGSCLRIQMEFCSLHVPDLILVTLSISINI